MTHFFFPLQVSSCKSSLYEIYLSLEKRKRVGAVKLWKIEVLSKKNCFWENDSHIERYQLHFMKKNHFSLLTNICTLKDQITIKLLDTILPSHAQINVTFRDVLWHSYRPRAFVLRLNGNIKLFNSPDIF